MNFNKISLYRLVSQQIINPIFNTAKDLVGWMGAMQAQDFAMAKLAAGIRIQGATEKAIEEALNIGEIFRTHAMRPTWHFVTSEDIYWLTQLTGPRIKSSLKSRHKQLELDTEVLKKTNSILENALGNNNHLTREELVNEFHKNKISTNDNRAAHILMLAELDGLICSGKMKGKKNTYALLEERIQKKNGMKEDEAVALLAKKYFRSHGPATLQDFTWWSGFPATNAKKAIEMVKTDFESEVIKNEKYWYDKSLIENNDIEDSLFFLPAFDEYLISYKNRQASLLLKFDKKIISVNGIFWPVIIKDGQVTGRWKRSFKDKKVIIEPDLFISPDKKAKNALMKAADSIGRFLEYKVELILP